MVKLKKTKQKHIVQGVLVKKRDPIRKFFDWMFGEDPEYYRLGENSRGHLIWLDGKPTHGWYVVFFPEGQIECKI